MSFAAAMTSEARRIAKPGIAFLRTAAPAYTYGGVGGAVLLVLLKFVSDIPDLQTRWSVTAALATAAIILAFVGGEKVTSSAVNAVSDRATVKAELKELIASYAARQPDWDGMDGIAPRPDAIADALTFVDQLPSSIAIPDDVFAPGDGEVMFQWQRSRIFIEVGFYGDDTISWFARLPGKSDCYGDDPFDRRGGRRISQTLADALQTLT